MTFHDRVTSLIDRLRDERHSGAFDKSIDGDITQAREHWARLNAEERRAAAALAADLAADIRSRPEPAEDSYLAALEAEAASYDEDGDSDPEAYDEAPGGLGTTAEASGVYNAAQPNPFTQLYDGPADPDALLAHLGYASFRPGQRDAVEAALSGRSALVVMPTGGGKSLCYQLPGLRAGGVTVVVSPLIALMADQVRRLADDGHPAVMISSGMDADQVARSMQLLRDGHARIVFCAPERFQSASFLQTIKARGVDLFVIDEAHCLAEWGHDFRPDYLRLPGVLQALGGPPVMAATATATEQVAEEIITRLQLTDPVIVRSGFDRPNLSFDVLRYDGKGSQAAKRAQMIGVLSDPAARPAVVYCGTRKDCETVAGALTGHGVTAEHYHAGLPADRRTAVQNAFMNGDTDVIVATNAFGMGVDKADIRTVIHWALPTSVEAYYQEAGRAGRDGKPGRAILLASRSDLGRLIRFNKERELDPSTAARYLERLKAQADGSGAAIVDAQADDEQRLLRSILERAGALTMTAAGRGQLHLQLHGSLDMNAVSQICRESKDRGWKAYKAIEQYAFSDMCRRRALLEHFGDLTDPQPGDRCCDHCDPDLSLPAPAAIPASQRTSRRTGSSGKAAAPSELAPEHKQLYDKLVSWRMKAADGKPAYTVATNATLQAICQTRPATPAQLQNIKGVGPAFMEKHGATVIGLVTAG